MQFLQFGLMCRHLRFLFVDLCFGILPRRLGFAEQIQQLASLFVTNGDDLIHILDLLLETIGIALG